LQFLGPMVEEEVEPVDPDGYEIEEGDELSELAESIESGTPQSSGGSGQAVDGRRAFKVVHPARAGIGRRWRRKQEKLRPERQSSNMRLRVLPLLGATLGLICFVLPWDKFPAFGREVYHRLGDYVFMYPHDYAYLLAISAALVLAGSVLLFVTSFGGLVQLSGLLMFLYGMPGDISHLEVGFVVCAVGAIFGCGSFVFRAPLAVPDRLLTFARGPGEGGRMQVGIIPLSSFIMAAVACALPWFVEQYTWRYSAYYVRSEMVYSRTVFTYMFDLEGDLLVITGASIFVVGALFAILTPLSGIVQGAGLAMFFVWIQPRLYDFSSPFYGYDGTGALGAGFYIGMVAVALGVAGLFVPLRVNLPMRTLSSVDAAPAPPRPRISLQDIPPSFRSVLRRGLPITFVAMILLSAAVTTAALAYTQKWSSVVVYVGVFAPQGEQVDIAVYVDDVLVFESEVSSDSQIIAEADVAAGVHKISIDYCFLGLDPDGIDGTADYSTWCRARPFSETRVMATIGSYWTTVFSIGLETTPLVNGTEVVFGSIEWGGWWPLSIVWSDITLALTDGTDYVSWFLLTGDLDDGLFTEKAYDTRALGGTNVSCTVTDLYGDGYVNPGDHAVFSAVDGTSFSTEVVYVLYVMYDSERSLIGECELEIG
jgi:hypothetical protein